MEQETKTEACVKLKEEHMVLKHLYDSLINIPESYHNPAQKYDYIKARIFDCQAALKKIEGA